MYPLTTLIHTRMDVVNVAKSLPGRVCFFVFVQIVSCVFRFVCHPAQKLLITQNVLVYFFFVKFDRLSSFTVLFIRGKKPTFSSFFVSFCWGY